MTKAIGYCRISDDDQSRWSIGGQQDLIRDHCTKENIELTAIFTDEGESAKNFDRANWKELETFVKKNHLQVDYLFVMAYTRFSRNTAEALAMIEQLENRYHIRVLSITEPLHMHPESPYFHYIRTQIIQNGELELRIIKDRTRFGIHNAQKAGRYITAPPRGYLRSSDSAGNPIIIIDKEKSPLVREAFTRFINGETIIAIRQVLKEKGMDIRGNSDLQKMLQHPVYMGWVKQISYYDAPETLVKGIHEAIVTEEEWWQVQAIFDNKKKLQRTKLSDDFPFRGVLKCFCHRNYTGAFSTGNGGRIGYYKCNTHPKINLNAKRLHKQFDELLEEMSLPAHHIQYLQQAVLGNIEANLQERSSSSEKIRQQLSGIDKKIGNLEEKFIADDIDKATYSKWKKNYTNEKLSLTDQLASLQEPIDQVLQRYESSLSELGRLQRIYHAASIEEKQGFIREVFNNELYYQDNTYRTTYLLDLFHPKALVLKEKGLLIFEQPSVISANFSVSAPQRSIIEPLNSFLSLIQRIKAA